MMYSKVIGPALAVLIALAGCSSRSGLTAAPASDLTGAMMDIPVVRIAASPGPATAVLLGQNLWITAKHALASEETMIEIEGQRTPIRLLAAGQGGDIDSDWVVFEAEVPPGIQLLRELPPAWPVLREGDELILVGFPHGETATLNSARQTRLEVLRGCRVLDASEPDDPLVRLSAPSRRAYHGMSGGAVVQITPEGSPQLIGIYLAVTGKRFAGLTWDTAHLVRRLPTHSEVGPLGSAAPAADTAVDGPAEGGSEAESVAEPAVEGG